MNQFFLQNGVAKELQLFPHIIEFAIRRNTTIQLDSLIQDATSNIRIFYIIEGKFEWVINRQQHILYPGDLIIIQPGQLFGGSQGVLNIGKLCWLYIQVNKNG